MRKRLALVVVGPFALTGGALAAGNAMFPVVPFEFDPTGTGGVDAQWVTHEGLPDAGKSDHALSLAKNVPTPVFASAGAELKGVEDTVWQDKLGFDRQVDTYCGAGARASTSSTTLESSTSSAASTGRTRLSGPTPRGIPGEARKRAPGELAPSQSVGKRPAARAVSEGPGHPGPSTLSG